MSRLRFGASLKDALWAAQDGCCWICGGGMLARGGNKPNAATIDHVWPKSLYGATGEVGVTLLACRDCNGRRGNPKPTDAEIRALVRIWRKVDPHWLRFHADALDGEVRALELQRGRAEILKLLVTA